MKKFLHLSGLAFILFLFPGFTSVNDNQAKSLSVDQSLENSSPDNTLFLFIDNYGKFYIGAKDKKSTCLINNNLNKTIDYSVSPNYKTAFIDADNFMSSLGYNKEKSNSFMICNLEKIILPAQFCELLLELSSMNDCQKNKPAGKPNELGDFGKVEVLSYLILPAYSNPDVDFKLDVLIDSNGFYHIRSGQEISLIENHCRIVNGREGVKIKTIYFSFDKGELKVEKQNS